MDAYTRWQAKPHLIILATLALTTTMSHVSILHADNGDIIDRCRLDRDGIPHCSTPNRRDAEANKAILDSVMGYDIDERRLYLATAAEKWTKRQKGLCHDKEIDVGQVFNAYNYPGKDDGQDIKALSDPCDKEFAIWLFRKENNGRLPGALSRVMTIVIEETAATRKALKICPKEAREYLKALQGWLAAEKTLESAKPQLKERAQEKAQEKNDEREAAVRALNSCLG